MTKSQYNDCVIDCMIIVQKIESLRESLKSDKSDKAFSLDDLLFRALCSVEEATNEYRRAGGS